MQNYEYNTTPQQTHMAKCFLKDTLNLFVNNLSNAEQ
jgi:hypothetical protein